MSKNDFTRTQQALLAKATSEWAPLPSGTGCASRSLDKLKRAGLVEVTLLGVLDRAADPHFHAWVWRLKPVGTTAVVGVPPAPVEVPRANPATFRRDQETIAELDAEIIRLRAALKGPDDFATWQAAAEAERIRRVKAERALSATGIGRVRSFVESLCKGSLLDSIATHEGPNGRLAFAMKLRNDALDALDDLPETAEGTLQSADGLVVLDLRTRRPEDYVLTDKDTGEQWKPEQDADGAWRWVRASAT